LSSCAGGAGEFARDIGWSGRPPQVGELRSAGARRPSVTGSRDGMCTRNPSSLRKG
jgi:hypothetical protein